MPLYKWENLAILKLIYLLAGSKMASPGFGGPEALPKALIDATVYKSGFQVKGNDHRKGMAFAKHAAGRGPAAILSPATDGCICINVNFLVEIYRQVRKAKKMAEKNWLQTLSRSRTDKWFGGVCGGFGKHTPIPSWCWRLLFVVLLLFFGTGLLLYILLWVFMPQNAEGDPENSL